MDQMEKKNFSSHCLYFGSFFSQIQDTDTLFIFHCSLLPSSSVGDSVFTVYLVKRFVLHFNVENVLYN